jgi:class 3 adenylate cyclase
MDSFRQCPTTGPILPPAERVTSGWVIQALSLSNRLDLNRAPAHMDLPEGDRSSTPEMPRLRTAHVVSVDIVSYSLMATDEQSRAVHQLQSIILELPGFAQALAADELICIPTGDGMAIVCFGEPTAPVRFARDLAIRIQRESPFALRIGLHNGPVYCSADINANKNVAGGGINVAQRVMDCGDAGHILLSQSVADTLLQLSEWRGAVQDLGECEVKHGVRLRLTRGCGWRRQVLLLLQLSRPVLDGTKPRDPGRCAH